ncbi:MAG: PAS domain-containing protein, partial [Bacteroidetes bacterium]|nr:PAS domain-containing protein [Bacteroidota bacterium]
FFWEYDIKEKLIHFDSKNLYRILGYDFTSPMKMRDYLLLTSSEEEIPQLDAYNEQFDKTTELVNEFRIRKAKKADGSIVYLQASAMSVKNEEGEAVWLYGSTRDITDNYLTHERLRESHERYELASMATYDFFWELDIEKDLLYFNPETLKRTLGHDLLSPIPMDEYLKLTRTPDTYLSMQQFRKDIRNSNYTSIEYPIQKAVKPDGTIIYIKASALTKKDKTGKIVRLYGSTRDITENYLSSEALRISNERYEMAMQATNDFIWEYELATGLIHFNPDNMAKVTGYHFSSPMKIEDYIYATRDKEEADLVMEIARNINDQGKEHKGEITQWVKKSDGSYMFISAGFIAKRNEKGQVERVYASMRDITESHIAQEQLKASMERFETVANISSDLIWEYDTVANEISFNETRLKEMLDMTETSPCPVDRFFSGFMISEDIPVFWQERAEAEKNKETLLQFSPKRYTTDSGELRYASIIAKIFRNEKGEPFKITGVTHDITDRYKKELEIRRSNERYETVSKISNDFIWEVDLATGLLHFNEDRLMDLVGEKISSPCDNDTFMRKYIHPDDWEQFIREREESAQSGKLSCDFSVQRYTNAAGKIIYIKTSIRVVVNNTGQPEKIIGVSRNITKEYLADEEIRRSNERYETIANISNELIWENTLHDNLLYFNKERLEKLYEIKEPSPVNAFEFLKKYLHPDDLVAYATILTNETGGGKDVIDFPVHRWVTHLYNKEKIYYTKTTVRVFRNEAGNPVRIIGSTRDITPAYLAEKELKNSNERYELAAQASYDTFWERDFEKNTYTFSKAFTHNFGHSYEEEWPVSRFKDVVLHPEDRNRIHAFARENYRNQNIIFRYPVHRFIKKDGSVAYVDVRCISQYDNNGKPVKTIGVIRDITEMQTMQVDLQKSNDRFRLATLASYDLIWDLDMPSGIISYSDAINTLWGYNVSAPMNALDFLKIFIHPDDIEMLTKAFWSFIKSKDIQREMPVHRVYKKDGTVAYVLVRAMAIRGQDGYMTRMVGATRDITKQYLDELELRKSNQRYEQVASVNFDLIMEVDIVEGKMFVSDIFKDYYGYNIKDFKTAEDAYKKVIHPDDFQWVMKEIFSNRAGKEDITTYPVFRLVKKDGEIVYCNAKAIFSRNEKGEAIRSLAVIRNVTESYFAELEIKKINERYELAAKASFDMLWERDFVTDSYYFSEALKRNFGYDQNEKWTVENFRSILIHPEDREKTIQYIDSCYTRQMERFRTPVHRYIKKDGSIAYVDVFSYVVYNNEGKPTRTIGVTRNVTSQHLLEKQLTEANQRYELVARATSDAVWEWNYKTNKVIFWNEGIKNLFGYDIEGKEVELEWWSDKIEEQDLEATLDSIDQAIKKRKNTFRTEYRFVTADDYHAHVMDRGYISYDADGVPDIITGSMQDITEVKHLEQKIIEDAIRHQRQITELTIQTQEKEREELGRELH